MEQQVMWFWGNSCLIHAFIALILKASSSVKLKLVHLWVVVDLTERGTEGEVTMSNIMTEDVQK